MSEYKTADELIEAHTKAVSERKKREDRETNLMAQQEIRRIEQELEEGQAHSTTTNRAAVDHFVGIGLECYRFTGSTSYYVCPRKIIDTSKKSWIKKLFNRG